MVVKFVDYTKLSNEDSKRILDIRNLDYIKEQMLSTKAIKPEEHCMFMSKLMINKTKKYFAVFYGTCIIGSLSIVQNNKQHFTWGIYFIKNTNPLIIGCSAFVFIDYIFNILGLKNIQSIVKINNAQALLFNKNLGFTEYNKDEIYHYLKLDIDTWYDVKKSSKIIRTLEKQRSKIDFSIIEG